MNSFYLLLDSSLFLRRELSLRRKARRTRNIRNAARSIDNCFLVPSLPAGFIVFFPKNTIIKKKKKISFLNNSTPNESSVNGDHGHRVSFGNPMELIGRERERERDAADVHGRDFVGSPGAAGSFYKRRCRGAGSSSRLR